MNRLLVTIAAAAVLYGCARTAVNTPVADQPYYDSLPTEVAAAPTTIVREIHHYEPPEVYVDTVYIEEEPADPEVVYIEEPVVVEYETYVYVSDPPHRHPHRGMPRSGPGWRGNEPRNGHGPRGGNQPRERGQQPSGPRDRANDPRDGEQPRGGGRPGGGGGRPGGGGQPRQPDPPERPRPVVGPTDGPKRSEPPRPAEPTPTPTAPVPSRPQTRLVRSESPATPAVQSPESADAVFTIPVRDVKPVPVERSAAAEQGS